jgi:hypothetical protein
MNFYWLVIHRRFVLSREWPVHVQRGYRFRRFRKEGTDMDMHREIVCINSNCNVCYNIVTGQAWVERLNNAAVWFLNLFTNDTTEWWCQVNLGGAYQLVANTSWPKASQYITVTKRKNKYLTIHRFYICVQIFLYCLLLYWPETGRIRELFFIHVWKLPFAITINVLNFN